MNIKKIFSCISASVTAIAGFTLMPVNMSLTYAEDNVYFYDDGDTTGNFYYSELEDGTLTITKFDGIGENLTIPSEINGKTVTRIDEKVNFALMYFGVFSGKDIKTVVIPDTIEYIGDCTFKDCSELTSITLSKNLKTIDYSAFSGCVSLETVELNEGLEVLGDRAFRDCEKLKSVKIPDTVTTIGETCFYSDNALEEVNIPKNITSVGDSAFKYTAWFDNLKDSAESYVIVGDVLLDGEKCKNDVTIPEGVKVIAGNAFHGSEMTSVALPKTLKYIGDSSFKYQKIESIEIPSNVEYIGKNAFEESTLSEITFNEGLKKIDEYAFYCCENLKRINLPEGLESLGKNAFSSTFENTSDLVSIKIPESLTDFSRESFEGTMWFKNLKNSQPYVIINGKLLYSNKDLINKEFPAETVKYEIYDCDQYTLPDTVEIVGKDTLGFASCIKFSENVKAIENEAGLKSGNIKYITILNPECNIYDSVDTFSEPVTIKWNNQTYTSTIFGYRNSTAQVYAEKYGYKFVALDAEPDAITLGDINGDSNVDATDASLVLAEYAAISTGKTSTLSDSQRTAADINNDGLIDANDASIILAYYSYLSTGGTESDIHKWLAVEEG